jgi:hypothetical protein
MITLEDLEVSRIRLQHRRYGRGWQILHWRNIQFPRLTTMEDWRQQRTQQTAFTWFVDDAICGDLDDILARLNAQPAAKARSAA